MPDRVYFLSDEEAFLIDKLEKLGKRKVSELVEVLEKYNISIDDLVEYLKQVKRIPSDFETRLTNLSTDVEALKKKVGLPSIKSMQPTQPSAEPSRPDEKAKLWSKEEIYDFLEDRTERQILFLWVLSEHEEIAKDGLIEIMAKKLGIPDYSGRTLSGSLGSLSIRINNLKKESLHRTEWRKEKGEWGYYYWLRPKYVPIIKEWLEQYRKIEKG